PAKAKKPAPAKPKAAPPPPPPAEESAEVSKPAWFKEAVAEEAKRKSGPVADKKKSTPVLPQLPEPRKTGPKPAPPTSTPDTTWKEPVAGGRGKLIAAIAAGAVAIAGIGVGVDFLKPKKDDG